MSFILTQPQGAFVSGANIRTTVPGGGSPNTVVVDSVPCSYQKGAKWIINITDEVTKDCFQQEISGHQRECGDVAWTRYALVGVLLPHTIDVVVNSSSPATSMELLITNPTSNDYSVDITRLDVLD